MRQAHPNSEMALNNHSKQHWVPKLSFVAMLHESLIKFLDDLAEKTITLFSDYFYKDIKFQMNCSDPANLPKSIKQNGLVTLQSKDEVTECKDYQNTPT